MPYLHHQFWPLAPVIPANTPATAPVLTPWPIVQGICSQFRVTVPPGHSGLTGFKIVYCGQQIVPWSNNAWWTIPGTNQDFPWDAEIMATNLVFAAYNTDAVPHQFWAYADVIPELGTPPGAVGGTDPLASLNAGVLPAIAALTG